MPKAHSKACERNRDPILNVLREVLADAERVLEIGSGTGQHAVYFADNLPHLTWQPSDRPDHLDSVRAWADDAGLDNLAEPIALDLFGEPDEPALDEASFEALAAINVIHIAPWEATGRLFGLAERLLGDDDVVYLYGPYRYADRPLEPSNERFDQWLKERDPKSGIRLFEDVRKVANAHGFELGGDRAMPANNRSLWWRKCQ